MTNLFYLFSIVLGLSGQNVVKKAYAQKADGKGVYSFNTVVSLSAILFFILSPSPLDFHISILPYAIGFAVCYTVASVFTVLAIACGSLSLTSLLLSYSLMIPTFYGLIFLHDPISWGFIVGLVFLVVSLFLINKTKETARFSFKWLVYVLLSFVGNGMCTVLQKMQQDASQGAYKNEFMIIALAIVAAITLTLSLIKEKKEIGSYVRSGWLLALICGLLNGMVNMFVMILSGRMPVSLMFPLVSAGGLIITYAVSKFLYKETLSKTQFIGFVFGLAAVVFLNT